MTKNTDNSSLPPAYRVIIGGKDMSRFVMSITNSFQLDETDPSSSVNLRSDNAQDNIELLREIIQACNQQIASKVYVRGLYSNEEKLRMSGYATDLRGANFFTGVSLTIKQNAANAENPDFSDSEPYTDKTVRDIMIDIIKKNNFEVGIVGDFNGRLGSWMPGNRTLTEKLTVLADMVGAIVNIRPPTAKIKDGKIKIDGIFEEPKPPDGKTFTEKELIDNRKSLFYLRSAEEDVLIGGGNSDIASINLADKVHFDNLTPKPGDVGGEVYYGPGKKVNDGSGLLPNGPYYGKDGNTPYGDQKSATKQKFEKLQQENIDPFITDLIDKSKIQVYKDRTTGEIIQAVNMIDNAGKEIIVPVPVAVASLKGKMVIDVLPSDEAKGMLGDSGLILTLKKLDLIFPYVRVKDIIGWEYSPPRSAEAAMPTAPGTDGTSGGVRKNYLTQKIKIKPTDTVDSIANQYPQVFKRFIYKDEITGVVSEYILANDPENLRVDKATGNLEPYDEPTNQTQFDENGRKRKAREFRQITQDEFNSLSPEVVHELYQKRRAALFNANTDTFVESFYPELDKAINDANDTETRNNAIRIKEDTLQWERDNNIYVEKLGKDGKLDPNAIIYTKTDGAILPPVFRPNDTVGSFLGLPKDSTEEASLYVGGKLEGKREDGRTPQIRANSIMFNPASGVKYSGQELNQKGDFPFSMSVTIDNCVEITTGQILNADETFGPFMGPYVIGQITESITQSSMSMTLELRTQSYMDGYGRAMNSPTSSGALGSGINTDTEDAREGANAGQVIPDNTRSSASGSGGKIVNSAINGLTASWSAKTPGYCSAYTRASVEHAYNLPSSVDSGGALSSIFGADAIGTEVKMRQAGLTSPYNKNALQAGTLIIIGHGSGGFGHIGINGGDGYVYENSWRYGGPEKVSDGRYRTPIDVFLREGPTSVVHPDKIDQYVKNKFPGR